VIVVSAGRVAWNVYASVRLICLVIFVYSVPSFGFSMVMLL